MKKILGLVLGLLFTLPAWATDEPLCNLYNKADGVLNGYPSADLKWTTGGKEHTIMMHLTEGETYTVKRVAGSSASFRIEASDTQTLTSGQTLHSIYITDDTSINTQTFTVPSGYPYVLFYIYNTQQPQITPQQAIDGFVLVKGSTVPSEYIEYNPLCATCEGTVKDYTTATGTVSQDGTPTPEHPVEPVFYKQGNMILRKVGDVADSYDANTGKITRRVGVKVLSTGNGCSRFDNSMDVIACSNNAGLTNAKTTTRYALSNALSFNSGHLSTNALTEGEFFKGDNSAPGVLYINFGAWTDTTLADFKSWIERQYVNGNPVTIWYPLETPTEETIGTTWCDLGIKVATKRYSDSKFNPVMTALNSAISTIKTVVTNTINQAAAVESLQNGKQTMPNASATNGTCPNYKQCLLVETSDGTPKWFVITDPFRDFVAPIIGANLAPENYSNPTESYTQLQYIESTGTQYIDTGVFLSGDDWEFNIHYDIENASEKCLFGVQPDSARLLVLYNQSLYLQAVGNAGTNRIRSNIYPSSNHTLNIRINNGTVQYQVDNGTAEQYSDVGSTEFDTSIFSVSSLKIFAYYNNGSIQSWRIAAGKLYSFSIKHNGTLVRDFVPVVNNTTGKYGMYDKVNGMFYGNANTASGAADFTPGPMVDNDAGVPNISWIANWNAAPASNMSAGSANGTSRCNNLVASANALATSATLSDANWSTAGNNCWCKVLSINVGGIVTDVSNQNLWSFHKTDASCNTGCNQWCGYAVKYARDCRNAIMNIN